MDLSNAACSSVTCGSWSVFGPLVSGATGVVAGFFDASSLAVRCCRAARVNDLGGAEGLVLNATDRAVKRRNRGGIVRTVCDMLK